MSPLNPSPMCFRTSQRTPDSNSLLSAECFNSLLANSTHPAMHQALKWTSVQQSSFAKAAWCIALWWKTSAREISDASPYTTTLLLPQCVPRGVRNVWTAVFALKRDVKEMTAPGEVHSFFFQALHHSHANSSTLSMPEDWIFIIFLFGLKGRGHNRDQ